MTPQSTQAKLDRLCKQAASRGVCEAEARAQGDALKRWATIWVTASRLLKAADLLRSQRKHAPPNHARQIVTGAFRRACEGARMHCAGSVPPIDLLSRKITHRAPAPQDRLWRGGGCARLTEVDRGYGIFWRFGPVGILSSEVLSG